MGLGLGGGAALWVGIYPVVAIGPWATILTNGALATLSCVLRLAFLKRLPPETSEQQEPSAPPPMASLTKPNVWNELRAGLSDYLRDALSHLVFWTLVLTVGMVSETSPSSPNPIQFARTAFDRTTHTHTTRSPRADIPFTHPCNHAPSCAVRQLYEHDG